MAVKYKIDEAEMERQIRAELLERNRRLGIEQTLEYIKDYGHLFVLEGEDVMVGIPHIAGIEYLIPILKWLFHDQNTAVVPDFRFFVPGDEESKVGPDIAIVDDFIIDSSIGWKSYGVGMDGPAPRVVFEFASPSTWEYDVSPTEKRGKYARMGIREYYACDTYPEQVWKGEWLERGRLVGWRLNPQTRQYDELKLDGQGRLESLELQSWLKMDSHLLGSNQGYLLRLYDLQGNLRLNETQVAVQRVTALQAHAEQIEAALLDERKRVAELEALLRQFKIQP